MSPADYDRCVRREQERQARFLTVKQMKEQLGLDRTVRGHTRMRRDEVSKAWVDNRINQPAA